MLVQYYWPSCKYRKYGKATPVDAFWVARDPRIAILVSSRILRCLRFLLFQDETNNMHPLFAQADRLSGEVIGAAIEVHRIMGPGLLESIYERCLLRELELRGIPVLNQEEIAIDYKGTVFKEKLKFERRSTSTGSSDGWSRPGLRQAGVVCRIRSSPTIKPYPIGWTTP